LSPSAPSLPSNGPYDLGCSNAVFLHIEGKAALKKEILNF